MAPRAIWRYFCNSNILKQTKLRYLLFRSTHTVFLSIDLYFPCHTVRLKGNQASVGVVRGIAVGAIDRSNVRRVLQREFLMGLTLSVILALSGFIRAAVFKVPMLETFAITSSLFMIVIISVVVGSTLPLGMQMVGIDPAHSSTTIQVIMDVSSPEGNVTYYPVSFCTEVMFCGCCMYSDWQTCKYFHSNLHSDHRSCYYSPRQQHLARQEFL